MKIKFISTIVSILTVSVLPVFAAEAGSNKVLDAYTAVSTALAGDDLAGAQKAAKDLATAAKAEHPKLADNAEGVAASDSLEKAREKFRPVSKEAVELAAGKDGYFVLTCPMAKADWVQKDEQVANPFYGSEMLRCGSIKK